jgi:death-on-curing protein
MMILNVAEVIELNEKLIAATGGLFGIRDQGLLDSAVMSCCQSFNGDDLDPTAIEKAARMAFAICKNHPFVDGNKRVAVTAMLVILRMSGISLIYTQQELIALGLGIAESGIDYEQIVAWIKVHMKLL